MKNILYLFFALMIISCAEDNISPGENIKNNYSCAYSVIVNNNKVLVSGFANTNTKLNSKYWIDSSSVDSVTFIRSLNNGSIYKEPVDGLGRKVYVHKALNGENDIFKFDQGSFADEGKIFYYRNSDIVRMDTSALGTITSVYISDNIPFFAGYFCEIMYTEAGESLSPKTPFFWDGISLLIDLPLPNDVFFRGVSCIYVDEEDYYIGGLMDFPMYWKSTEPVALSSLYGEVNQITVSESNVYAVGLLNKNNSNSTGHTACYWKNGELFELDDDAQAYGIFIDGNDIYVSGSIGNVPSQYKACYWKNGVRVDLPN